MKIAVLGGNGYIGGRVAAGLAGSFDTTIITRRPYLLNGCKNIVVDFSSVLLETLIDFDVIINFVGANRSTTKLDPVGSIGIKQNISECLSKLSKIKKIFVLQASSKHIYSSVTRENEYIHENNKDHYALGHLASEEYLGDNFSFDNGSTYQIMRLSNFFGYAVTDSKEFSNLFLNQLIVGLIKERPLVIKNPNIISSFTPLNVLVDYIRSVLSGPFPVHDNIVDIGVPHCFSLGDATLLMASIFRGEYDYFGSHLLKSEYGSRFISKYPSYASDSWFISEVEDMLSLYSDSGL